MTPHVLSIVKRELTDAIRSKTIWGAVLALFVMASSSTIAMYLRRPRPATYGTVSENIPLSLFMFMPIIALLIGYNSIVGEKESGSIRFLYGLPTSRSEILVGKLLGRGLVFVITLLTAIFLLVALNIVLYGGIGITQLIAHTLLLVLYGLVWVGIGVGVSAASETRFQAVAGVFGLYAIFTFFWRGTVLPLLAFVITGDASTSTLKPIVKATEPTWYLYVQRLNPVYVYQVGRGLLIEVIDSAPANVDAAITYPMNVEANAFGFTIWLAWFVVPLVVGYWRFKHAEF